jgi:AraC-like DNA-binding protein
MDLDYIVKQTLVKKIFLVTHKGKKRGFFHALHTHGPTYHEIIYVDYGKLNLLMDDRKIILNPGECILIRGGTKHSFAGESGAPFDYLNIEFAGNVPQSLFGKSMPVNRKCLELLEKLKQESVNEMPYCREAIACHLTDLIINLFRQINVSIPSKLPETANRHRYQLEYVNRVLAIIANEYSKPLNLGQLSRAAGIGKSRLCKLLKIETGENFSTVLHKQRVAAAKHLLSEGSFSIEHIANSVGYSNSSFFFRIFKRITGMTPKEYSQSLGEPVEKA